MNQPRAKRVIKVQIEDDTKGEIIEAKIKLAMSGTTPNAKKATSVVIAEAKGVSSASLSTLRMVAESSLSRISNLESAEISAVEYSVQQQF